MTDRSDAIVISLSPPHEPDRSEVVREALKRYFEQEMNGPQTVEQ